MLKPKPPPGFILLQLLSDRIIPQNHLLRKINQVVGFSFVHD